MSVSPSWQRLNWAEIDATARSGDCFCFRRGNDMAVARWDGARFVSPPSFGRPLEFEPTHYMP